MTANGLRGIYEWSARFDDLTAMSAKKAQPNPVAKPERSEVGARIRVLTQADRETWIELRRRLWPQHAYDDLAQDADTFLKTEQGGKFWRATMPATVLLAQIASGKIVGFAEADLRPYADGCRSSPVGYVEGWYVLPGERRRGIGRALILSAEAWARSQGCVEMASDTEFENVNSQRAHASLGYEEVDRLVHFRRKLTGPPE